MNEEMEKNIVCEDIHAEEVSAIASDVNDSAEESNKAEGVKTPEILNLDYRYIRLLGEGANGRTWLAKERKTGLDVCVKELKFIDDFKAWELFHREAEVLKSIKVDGVPKYIDSVFASDFTSYIIQEYIPYPSLDDFLQKGIIFDEVEVYTLLDLITRILFALQTQYIPAIIHRDIKPGNILYRRATANSEPQVWLIDFGAVDNAHKQSSGSTIAGTFGYMSPEQLQGEVSPRSDFYSLGATALHLLTGVFPYEIPSELFALKFHPVIEEKAPDTTKPMIELLDVMLASNAENRPQDILALRNSLENAAEASEKYRLVNKAFEIHDPEPKTKFGKWFRNTKFGKNHHDKKMARLRRRMEKARLKQIKKIEKQERIAKQKRLKEELKRQKILEKSGIIINVDIKRISVAGSVAYQDQPSGYDEYGIYIIRNKIVSHLNENILEGIFQHEGNWYPAYLRKNNVCLTNVRCSLDAQENEKVSENTFAVKFMPQYGDILVISDQIIWLSEEYYTKFTGSQPMCKTEIRNSERIIMPENWGD